MEEFNKHAMPPMPVQLAEEQPAVTLTDLYHNIKARWRWYVVSVILCLGLATLYLMRVTPMYTRTTEILLKDETSESLSIDPQTLNSSLGIKSVPSSILNEMFVLSSPELLTEVVGQLDLNEVYKTGDKLRKRELYHTSPVIVETNDSTLSASKGYSFRIVLHPDNNTFELSKFRQGKEKYSRKVTGTLGETVETPLGMLSIHPTKLFGQEVGGKPMPTTIYYSYTPPAVCARTYRDRLKTEYMEDLGDIISMAITCESAQKAGDILQSIVATYNRYWIEERERIALATSNFIDDRLKAIESELGDVETTISDYKSRTRLIDMDAMAQIYLSQSTDNQRQLNALAQEMAIARFIRSELAANDITRLLPSTAEIGGTDIQQLVTAYNTAVTDRNVKLLTMPEESPLMVQKTDAIMRQREAILASLATALETLNARYNAINMLDRKNQEQLATAPSQAKYLMSEERKQKVKESLYVFLLQRREENNLSSAFTAYNTRMVTEPYGPSAPTSPKKSMIYLIALVAGLAIPTALIYFIEVMNTRVRSRRDIEEVPIPFMGEIPLDDKKGSKWRLRKALSSKDAPQLRPLRVHPGHRNVIGEAFRMVRTNLGFMNAMQHTTGAKGAKVVMVVSLNAGSGKTFVTLNLAASYAFNGKRVCLVDFDLRKGTVSLNAGSPAQGLTSYIVGRTDDLDSLIVRNVEGIEGFDILPMGIKPPNPTELLYSERVAKAIEHLRGEYDYIFLDCPPVEIVADARILNTFADTTLFVLRAGLFEKADLPLLTQFYTTGRYNNLAMVLNATDRINGVYGTYGYGARYLQQQG